MGMEGNNEMHFIPPDVQIFTEDEVGQGGHHDRQEGVEHGNKHGAFLLVAPQLNDNRQAIAGDSLKNSIRRHHVSSISTGMGSRSRPAGRFVRELCIG